MREPGVCKICFLPIKSSEDATMMGALGKPLFLVHSDCAPVVRTGVEVVRRVAIKAFESWLGRKHPRTAKAAKSFHQVLGEMQKASEEAIGKKPAPTTVEAEIIE